MGKVNIDLLEYESPKLEAALKDLTDDEKSGYRQLIQEDMLVTGD